MVELWGDCSNAYTSLSACFRSLLGMWVAYIMFTIRTCGGNPFCPPVCGCRGSSSSSLCGPLSSSSSARRTNRGEAWRGPTLPRPPPAYLLAAGGTRGSHALPPSFPTTSLTLP